MKKLNNKGFSLIEIIIAIAIFALLIIPVISQLGSSMSISATSKKKQQSAEYAEYLMEYFKSTPLSQVGKDGLFEGKLAEDGVEQEIIADINTSAGAATGEQVTYKTRTFKIDSGNTVTIGGKKNQYYTTVTIDTKDYALSQLGYKVKESGDSGDVYMVDGDEYVKPAGYTKEDPNQVNTATLTNLDSNKVAIIAGSASNFDSAVSDAFFSLKAEQLKKVDEEKWMQLMYGDASYNEFANDTVDKITRISITKSGEGMNAEYKVTCVLEYRDSNTKYNVDDLSYSVYSQSFKQKDIPNIYFLYNPCLYNGEYMSDDNIVLDTTGLPETEQVKFYLIRTSSKVPKSIYDVINNANVGIEFTDDLLIKEVAVNVGTAKRNDVITKFSLCTSASYDSSKAMASAQVFTNYDIVDDPDADYDYDGIPNHLDTEDSYLALYGDDFYSASNIDSTTAVSPIYVLTDKTYFAPGADFVKPLSDDTEIEGRLYTIRVKLYEKDGSLAAEYKGTRGAD